MRDIIPCDIASDILLVFDSETIPALFENMLVRRYQESRRPTCRIEDCISLRWVYHCHEEVDDMTGCAELSRVTLTPSGREEILEGIAELFGVSIVELVDLLEESIECRRILEWEICIAKYISKELRNMRIATHTIESFAVEIESLLGSISLVHEVFPGILRIFSLEKTRPPECTILSIDI